ncbi:MAG: lipocalin family protein [bacterium]|nr:lipocalin family protein [bacterium]
MILLAIAFAGASAVRAAESTDAIPPVPGFELNRYLGTWYEIVRLPHRFEKGQTRVTATYSLNPDGSIRVVNRGFKAARNKWSQAEAKAWVPDPAVPARLKVRFFWPFSGEYKVIQLDPEYRWAVVTSGTKNYFWILSRAPVMDEALLESLLATARDNGFDTAKMIRVEQDAAANP